LVISIGDDAGIKIFNKLSDLSSVDLLYLECGWAILFKIKNGKIRQIGRAKLKDKNKTKLSNNETNSTTAVN
jgi:hypothetical protein